MSGKIDKRAAAKTVTWRVAATITTVCVALVFTGSVEISIGIGTVEAILKMILYYLHERLWDRVNPTVQIPPPS
ncbi:MAG: DUF2061 domain-containing protein [Promethearchaeota archaeon]